VRSLTEVLLSELRSRQNADGGWGASSGAASNTECTALACVALQAQEEPAATDGDALEAAARWLLQRQETSGAWRYVDGVPIATWPTPIALLALRTRSDAARAVERGYAWLLEQRGASMPWRLRLKEFITGKQVIEQDTTLPGWPWVSGTLAWVEPTAWALMALKAGWPDPAPRRVRGRIRAGEDMVLDRACPGGGWNYGNSRVLGEELDAYADTTALALLGLRGRPVSAVNDGFRALDRLLGEYASGLALSLAALSRRSWGRDATDLQARLETSFAAGGFMGETRTLALAVLATAPRLDWLEGGPHA
jgi:hypothetical protein